MQCSKRTSPSYMAWMLAPHDTPLAPASSAEATNPSRRTVRPVRFTEPLTLLELWKEIP
jgi:hypothetical protein